MQERREQIEATASEVTPMLELMAVGAMLLAFFLIGIASTDLRVRNPRSGYALYGALMGGMIYVSKVVLSDTATFSWVLFLGYALFVAIVLAVVRGGAQIRNKPPE